MYFTTPIAIAILAFADSILCAPQYGGGDSSSTATTISLAVPTPAGHAKSAVYFMTNAQQNSVVSIAVGADGLLTGSPILTSTGGMGLGGKHADGTAAIPDSLFAQGTIRVVDNLLFAVNPGSHTLSLFKISAKNPAKLTQVGSPQSTGGEFPISVTYSAALKTACVVNGGAVDGITCFSVSHKGLYALDASPRPLGLGQTTPAVGPPNTASDIYFSPDSASLVVTVKGNPAVNNTGFVAVYPVSHGVVSRHATKSSPSGTALPFGIAAVGNTNTIVIADPSIGAAILSVDPTSFTTTTTAAITVANQSAICWSAYSSLTGMAYLADAGVNRIVAVNAKTGAIAAETVLKNGNGGMFDIIASGSFLYALAPTANSTHIVVMDISAGKGAISEKQNFEVMGLGLGTVMGIQVYEGMSDSKWW